MRLGVARLDPVLLGLPPGVDGLAGRPEHRRHGPPGLALVDVRLLRHPAHELRDLERLALLGRRPPGTARFRRKWKR